MAAAASVKCVVCEKRPAVLYCHQDDAHLCLACDEQVHSANLLASRHQRIPIVRTAQTHEDDQFRVPEPASVFEADPASAKNPTEGGVANAELDLVLDDDAFFAVPDVDLPGFATDDVPPKVTLGKHIISDEFDLGDIDPLWLDRLDVGMDRLPSDFLDSLVPEAAPPPRPPPKQQREDADERAESHREKPEPKPQKPKQQVSLPATVPSTPALTPVPMNNLVHPYPAGMHWVPCAHVEQPLAAPAEWGGKAPEAPMDIDSYIPHSLLPVDPATYAMLLRSRREKLDRFREKKRNRLFKKTIRYASRKAYAEVRPRIKGRFARKDEVAAMRAAGILPPL